VKQKGLTLLETIIALVILAGSLTLLVTSWSGSFLRLRKTQTQYELALLLEKKMGEVEMEFRGEPLTSIPEEKEGDFGSDYPQYKWKLTSQKLVFPDLSQLMNSQEGGSSQGDNPLLSMMMQQVTSLITQGAKEVTLTVSLHKEDVKPLEYSITTLFVDINSNPGIPPINR
jgi:general secretion pathway protein I